MSFSPQMMEDAGCWKQMRRMAGSGSGALIAALLCVGLTSSQLERYLRRGLSRHFKSKYSQTCIEALTDQSVSDP